MISERERAYRYALAGCDIAMLLLCFAFAYLIRAFVLGPLLGDLARPAVGRYVWLLGWAGPVYLFLLFRRGGYDLRSHRGPFATLVLVGKSLWVGSLTLGTAIFVVQAKDFSRPIFFTFAALSLVGLVGNRLIIQGAIRRGLADGRITRYCLIVGADREARGLARILNSSPGLGAVVVGHLGDGHEELRQDEPILGRIRDIKRILDENVIDEVLIALPGHRLDEVRGLISVCEERGITTHIKADFARGCLVPPSVGRIAGMPFLTFRSTPHRAADIVLKRLLDFIVSALALAILSPLLALVAVSIKLTSRGPIIFKQRRTGVNGRTFVLYKFRSMYHQAGLSRQDLLRLNEMSGPVFKSRNDPRVTPIGRLLRLYSVDELPQLWNVLKGDMSLVGPRPPVPEEVEQYEGWQRRRLSVKPGITCLWQVFGRNDIDFERWMELDLQYINQWSLALDLKILLKTIPAVFLARGAR